MTRIVLLAAVCLCLASRSSAQEPAGEPGYRIGVEYGYVSFGSDGPDPWHLATAELIRRGPAGALVGRVNWAERFGDSGVQLEADAYPRLSRRVFLFLNGGWSDSEVFPEARAGAELYLTMPGGIETSAGARRLWFRDSELTLVTGSVGLYAGSYYLSLRPYVAPRDEADDVSGSLLVRRYFGGTESYATLVVGAGSTPSEAPLEFEVDRLTSQRVTLYGRHPVSRHLGVRWNAGWEREELAADDDRTRLSAGGGLEVRF